MEVGQRVWVKPTQKLGTITQIEQGYDAIPVWGIDLAILGVVHVRYCIGGEYREYVGVLDDLVVIKEQGDE